MTSDASDGSARHTKSALRSRALACRDQLTEESRALAARAVAVRGEAVLAGLSPGSVIALYAAKGSELEVRVLDESARRLGQAVVYPRVVRGQPWLDFHLAEPAQLTAGAFGLREPAATFPLVPLLQIAAFFVPGLAFDETGARLGWGRGYYDSTFVRAPRAWRVGVAFECQVVEHVPRAAHDILLHELLTEARQRSFGA